MVTQTAHKKKASVLTFVLIFLGVLLVALVITFLVLFLRYRHVGNQTQDTVQSWVRVSQPENKSQFIAGTPIEVQVDANNQRPIKSIELWINGVLEGVQAGDSMGSSRVTGFFSWIPAYGGNFSLVARVIDAADNTSTSPSVLVFVTPREYSPQPGNGEGEEIITVVSPAVSEVREQPGNPEIGDVPAPAKDWQGSVGNWLTNMITTAPPAAPELVVTVDGCMVKLQIHDRSENEEGFSVFRQTTEDPEWVHAADLTSNPGTGWVLFEETGLYGGITYFVTAFNSQGATSSNLAMVNIDPQVCPVSPPSWDLPILKMDIDNLKIDSPTEKIYCYTILGDTHWSRWPEAGFVNDKTIQMDLLPLQKPILNAELTDSDIKTGPEKLDLKIECWGWEGGQLHSLGIWHDLIDDTKRIPIQLEGLAFDISPGYLSVHEGVLWLGDIFEPGVSVIDSKYDIDYLGYVPESDQMPGIVAWVTDNPEICKLFIQDEYKQWYECQALPGFNDGPGGLNPQYYLVWSLYDKGTCGGSQDKECFDYQWWEEFARRNPDPHEPEGIQFKIENLWTQNGEFKREGWSWDKEKQVMRIGPRDLYTTAECFNKHIVYRVSMLVNTAYGRIESSPSNLVAPPCPVSLGESVDIKVEWKSIYFDNIDDGLNTDLSDDHIAEGFGYFVAFPGFAAPLGVLQMGWSPGINNTDPPDGVPGYKQFWSRGNYKLAEIPLCVEQFHGKNKCYFDAGPSAWQLNNNSVTITVKDGDWLKLTVAVYDHDENSPHDPICDSHVNIQSRSIQDWIGTQDEHIHIIYPEGEGDAYCDVEVILNAIAPSE